MTAFKKIKKDSITSYRAKTAAGTMEINIVLWDDGSVSIATAKEGTDIEKERIIKAVKKLQL